MKGTPPPGKELPPRDEQDSACAMKRLLAVMARLRGSDGCPWDRGQTHRSLLPFLLEEAYELIEAIETPGQKGMREELGDVLLQVVFHAQIAAENGDFTFTDVARALADKLESRHPHVFGNQRLETAAEVAEAWQARKMKDRNSALDGIPNNLPALQWATALSARAARAGFEWHTIADITHKAREELGEFLRAREAVGPAALSQAQAAVTANGEDPELELGDLLFCLVQLARWSGIDPETALRRSSRKFASRFKYMETRQAPRGRQGARTIPADWKNLWEEAKASESVPE